MKAYVKRSKNDAADAAAICEAVTRPSLRFVPVKMEERQAALTVHRTRDLLIDQRTQLINSLRAHLAELGLVSAQGRDGLAKLLAIISDKTLGASLPPAMRPTLKVLIDQLGFLQQQIGRLDRAIAPQHKASDVSQRLESIPGIGVIGAPRQSQPPSAIQARSNRGVTSPPGSGSCRDTLYRWHGEAGRHI